MPSLAEIAAALYATWRLAHLDKTAFAHFDVSVAGAYKSFFAAVIVAPGYALVLLLLYGGQRFEASGPAILAMTLLGYVLVWTIFPLVAHAVLRALAVQERFIPLLVGYNWAQCLIVYALLPLVALAASGMLAGVADLLLFLAQIFVAPAYLWFILRTALKGDGHIAFGLLIVALMIELILQAAIEGRLGPIQG
ncbi:MAG: hypothetical protein WD489_01720 [Rhodovibrionaceae bacterium]